MALNSIEKLRIWCHKVLPLVYDDSLSYYEVLAKVVNKLNEVIALAEEQNETIEEALSDIETFETDLTSQFEAYKTVLESMAGKKVIIRTLIVSGALCGIAGLLLVGGTNHTISTTTVDGRGFTAIMVSWLAKFNPIVMVLTSFLIVFLEKGAMQVSSQFRVPSAISDIITGIILFFIIGCEFFINYKNNTFSIYTIRSNLHTTNYLIKIFIS